MKDLSFINSLPEFQRQAVLEGPAMKPPTGLTPNFINPPNKNQLGSGIGITAAILCTLLVILRIYSRSFYHKTLTIEDGLAVVSLGVFAAFLYCTFSIILGPGIFIRQWNYQVKNLSDFLYFVVVGSSVYGAVQCLLKTAILLEWTRLFVPTGVRNLFWWTCHVTIALNIVFYIICTFIEIFACSPRKKQWNPTLPGKCIDVGVLNIVSATLKFTIDMIILVLPQKVIWGLHMSAQKKVGVAILFATGIFGCVSAAARTTSAIHLARDEDVLYNAADMGMWCIAEMTSGFLVLCLPAIPKLFTESCWIRTISSIFLKSLSKNTTKNSRTGTGNVPTVGRWGKRRPTSDTLFTDADKSNFYPLTDVSVTSEFRVESGPIEEFDIIDKSNEGWTTEVTRNRDGLMHNK